MANNPKTKKKERMVEKKRKKKKKKKLKTAFWKERAGKKCQPATGQRLDTHNPFTQYNPLSSDNNTAGQQTLTNYPTQRKTERAR